MGWRRQGLRRGKDAGETQISRRKNLREIRKEDWVVTQTLWWEDQRPVTSEIVREFEISCWRTQGQIGGEHSRNSGTKEERPEKGQRRMV